MGPPPKKQPPRSLVSDRRSRSGPLPYARDRGHKAPEGPPKETFPRSFLNDLGPVVQRQDLPSETRSQQESSQSGRRSLDDSDRSRDVKETRGGQSGSPDPGKPGPGKTYPRKRATDPGDGRRSSDNGSLPRDIEEVISREPGPPEHEEPPKDDPIRPRSLGVTSERDESGGKGPVPENPGDKGRRDFTSGDDAITKRRDGHGHSNDHGKREFSISTNAEVEHPPGNQPGRGGDPGIGHRRESVAGIERVHPGRDGSSEKPTSYKRVPVPPIGTRESGQEGASEDPSRRGGSPSSSDIDKDSPKGRSSPQVQGTLQTRATDSKSIYLKRNTIPGALKDPHAAGSLGRRTDWGGDPVDKPQPPIQPRAHGVSGRKKARANDKGGATPQPPINPRAGGQRRNAASQTLHDASTPRDFTYPRSRDPDIGSDQPRSYDQRSEGDPGDHDEGPIQPRYHYEQSVSAGLRRRATLEARRGDGPSGGGGGRGKGQGGKGEGGGGKGGPP